jgi:hypothetical protein
MERTRRFLLPWAKWLAGAIPEPMQALGSGDIMRYLKDSVLDSHFGETSVLDASLQDQPETLMCYFGVGDTYTPAHKDLCASVGHNLLSTCISSPFVPGLHSALLSILRKRRFRLLVYDVYLGCGCSKHLVP